VGHELANFGLEELTHGCFSEKPAKHWRSRVSFQLLTKLLALVEGFVAATLRSKACLRVWRGVSSWCAEGAESLGSVFPRCSTVPWWTHFHRDNYIITRTCNFTLYAPCS